jgi:prepilin-type N-terminal cleavage/methylation domain-containing protein
MKLLSSKRNVRGGFTLIELLLVIGIIAILASIVIVAINPTKQLGNARNAQRSSDVNTIVNAVYQYAIDKNAIPSTIPTVAKVICKSNLPSPLTRGGAGVATADCVDLGMLSGTYLVNLPSDPSVAAGSGFTGYNIVKDTTTNGRVTVTAIHAEQSATISVTR